MLTYQVLIEFTQDSDDISIEDMAMRHANKVLNLLPMGTKMMGIEQEEPEGTNVVFNITYWHPSFRNGYYIEVKKEKIAWFISGDKWYESDITVVKYYDRYRRAVFCS